MLEEKQIVKFDNVSKLYNNQIAITDCNLEIKKGRIYGIVGPNGAGKTTLFKLILNLTKPSEGNICIDGKETSDKCTIKFGALIEMPYINQSMTAFQNLKFMQIMDGANNNDKIFEVIKTVGLEAAGKKKVKKFSLGMKQRLGIAMAIINDPDILILDEPMNGLDPEGIVEIRDMLVELNRRSGISMLISSHILGELDKFVTDYIFIKKGKIFLTDTKENIEIDMHRSGIDDFESYYLKTIKAYE